MIDFKNTTFISIFCNNLMLKCGVLYLVELTREMSKFFIEQNYCRIWIRFFKIALSGPGKKDIFTVMTVDGGHYRIVLIELCSIDSPAARSDYLKHSNFFRKYSIV